VISASDDYTLIMWDIEMGMQVHTLVGHENWVTDVAVMQRGRKAVSASYDSSLKVWDLERGIEISTVDGFRIEGYSDSGWVCSVAVNSDGRLAIASYWAGGEGVLKVWDLKKNEKVRTLKGHTNRVGSVVVTPDGRRVVSASDDNTLKVWDLETGSAICSFMMDAALHACAVGQDGATIVAGDMRGRVHFLRFEEGIDVGTTLK
jgi:WD40 repeat protein